MFQHAFMTMPDGEVVDSALVWRSGACGQLRLTAGRCATGRGEAMLSARAAGPYRVRLGSELALGAGRMVRVVGVYLPRDASATYWFDRDYFQSAPALQGPARIPAVFVARSTFRSVPPDALVRASVDYPLDPSRIRLADVRRVEAQVAAVRTRFTSGEVFQVGTDLSAVLRQAAAQRRSVEIGAAAVTGQLVLLGWLVLFVVTADAVEARGAELAAAKLRGFSRAALWRFGLTEPLLLIGVALPTGIVLASGGAALFAALALAPDTPVAVPVGSVVAAIGAAAGGLVAAAAAARRVLLRPVLEQWRRTGDPAPAGARLLALEVVVAVVAVAGLVLLRSVPDVPGGLLVAPALLVLAVALLGARLVPRAAGLLVAPTRATRRIGLFLASRQVARRPAGLRLIALLTAAVGLACFGVAGEDVAAGNRAARAEAELGAATVVSVPFDQTADPVAVTRRVDPDGRWAAAAATWLPYGGASLRGTLLAVDADRLASVATAARDLPSPARLASLLRAGTVPALRVVGTRLQARITTDALGRAGGAQVAFDLTDSSGRSLQVTSGPLRLGVHDYTATMPCTDGCGFTGITWARPGVEDGVFSGDVTLTGIAAGSPDALRQLPARTTQARAWRAAITTGGAVDRVRVTAAGVQDRFSADDGASSAIAYRSTAVPLPVVAAPAAVVSGIAAADRRIEDDTGAAAAIRIVDTRALLPVVLDQGAVADLTSIRQQVPDFDEDADWQVWLSPSAPADAVRRLEAAGLTVQHVETATDRVARLAREAPALSLLLLLVAAFIGALLAMAATAVAIAASARRRSYEAAALAVIRVPRPALHRAAVLEQLLLLGAAVVLGLPAGLAAALVVLPVLPEFATPTPIPLHYLPAPPSLLAFTALFVVLVTVTAFLAATQVLRAARPSRLREDAG
ncbi:FtsX-like permease family protein [Amnibacterium endophyticum]|uniref:FtsX-like permease family protein n=1 Tax=Amnibacterium endophyticum TaxID=2109337 RepID=A0ABW4LGQ1_9MICO